MLPIHCSTAAHSAVSSWGGHCAETRSPLTVEDPQGSAGSKMPPTSHICSSAAPSDGHPCEWSASPSPFQDHLITSKYCAPQGASLWDNPVSDTTAACMKNISVDYSLVTSPIADLGPLFRSSELFQNYLPSLLPLRRSLACAHALRLGCPLPSSSAAAPLPPTPVPPVLFYTLLTTCWSGPWPAQPFLGATRRSYISVPSGIADICLLVNIVVLQNCCLQFVIVPVFGILHHREYLLGYSYKLQIPSSVFRRLLVCVHVIILDHFVLLNADSVMGRPLSATRIHH